MQLYSTPYTIPIQATPPLEVDEDMESAEIARRKALQVAIANLCVEAGFTSVEKEALGTLTEIAQSCKSWCQFQIEHPTWTSFSFLPVDITELGRTSRVYSELASRTEPTASDVHMALIDAGMYV